jgi:hypothetical protein
MADNTYKATPTAAAPTQTPYEKLLAAQQAQAKANPVATSAAPVTATAANPITAAATTTPTTAAATGAYTEANFPYQAFLAANPNLVSGTVDARDQKRAYDAYVAQGKTWTPAAATGAAASPQAMQDNLTRANDAVTGAITNPQEILNAANGTNLSAQVKPIDPNTAGTNIGPATPANGPNATTATVTNVATGVAPVQGAVNTYTAEQTYDKVAANDMKGAVGTVDPQAIVDAEKIKLDVNAYATGKNPDGSVNEAGAAMNQAAQQNIVNVIDTSTMAGKLLAQSLGEGNYTDAKATLKGQLDILSAEFANPDGSAKIPSWAQGAARNVSKIASFSGMTGTAATSALATAIMEASIPVAAADATFFQTLTVKNLDNRQEQTINKANILSKMEMQNADMRMTAAIQNSQNFMSMSLANLNNEQQARVVNTQNRVQSILEDAKAVNTQRMFTAQSQNEMDMFYDNLNSQMSQFNAAQVNGMAQFNASETNDTSQFNAQLENSRQEFYKNMQFNIDVSNAKWRQTVTLTENDQKFQAAATDVQNLVGMTKEQMTQLWDRSDALLDYVWKSSESEKERAANLLISQNQIKAQAANAKAAANGNAMAGIFSGIGSVAGSLAGTEAGAAKLLSWL